MDAPIIKVFASRVLTASVPHLTFFSLSSLAILKEAVGSRLSVITAMFLPCTFCVGSNLAAEQVALIGYLDVGD